MTHPYELDDSDLELLVKIRKAIEYDNAGDPARDVISEREMLAGLHLLIHIIDSGYAVLEIISR